MATRKYEDIELELLNLQIEKTAQVKAVLDEMLTKLGAIDLPVNRLNTDSVNVLNRIKSNVLSSAMEIDQLAARLENQINPSQGSMMDPAMMAMRPPLP